MLDYRGENLYTGSTVIFQHPAATFSHPLENLCVPQYTKWGVAQPACKNSG